MAIRRDPFDSMDRMFEQMRRTMFGGMDELPFDERGRLGRPGSDVNLRMDTTDEGYLVMADLPGFEKADIDLRFEEGVLSIAAAHESETETDAGSSHAQRRVYDELRIPAAIREDEITASYRNGVLEVSLPTEDEVADDDEHRIEIE